MKKSSLIRGFLLPGAVLTTPIGRSAAIIFQVAREFINSRLSQASWAAPKMRAWSPVEFEVR